jgi:hypothetical protein
MFIGGGLVMLLWNWLLPPLFGWHTITFWQALAMLVLCRILFGGLGGGGRSRSNFRRRMADRMADQWGCMTPEERQRFRERIREKWGFNPSPSEPAGL